MTVTSRFFFTAAGGNMFFSNYRSSAEVE
jgi:hypothetical protein